jgi:hypothetical protein
VDTKTLPFVYGAALAEEAPESIDKQRPRTQNAF